MVNILGLHFGHDGSACIVKDGRLVSAISSERITGVKKFYGVTTETINYVLDKAGIGYEDIDMIALSDYILNTANGTLELYDDRGTQVSFVTQAVFNNDAIRLDGVLNGHKIPVTVLPHQLCHAASAFYTSNMDESVVFTMDGCGGNAKSSSMISAGSGTKLTSITCPELMVGCMYGDFTSLLGLGPSVFKAGSTMGLASYGTPTRDIVENLNDYINKTFMKNYYPMEAYNIFKQMFEKDERITDPVEISYEDGGLLFYSQPDYSKSLAPYNTVSGMNTAASIQYLFEQSILSVIKDKIKIMEETKDLKNICLAGGSFLNCNANSAIKATGDFENVHLFPAAGDDGICIGAALYVAHHILDYPRENYTFSDLAYMGSQSVELKEEEYKYLASEIANGKIIAWCSGQSEYGPRALGHRSILADPRDFNKREILNFLVKNREWFRPFAPVVLEEEAGKWFEPGDPSKYMLFTQKVLQPEKIPAVTHVDGTARIQTINEEDNAPYYKLIKEFFNITGVPALINTSFNGNSKPIIETRQQAINEFYTNTALDILVFNGEIITKP
jgi:carbamoyltransferase